MRKGLGEHPRGMLRFTDELIARTDRARASGPKLLRADSGFWAKKTFDRLDQRAGSSRSGCACKPMSARRSSRSTNPRRRPWRTTRRRRSRRSPRPRSQAAGSSFVACAPSTSRANCYRRGRSIRLPPTAATRSRPSRASTASTPSSSSRSATSMTSTRALPVGQVLRQRRLDGDRRDRAQPAALDQRPRAPRPHDPRRTHPQTPPAHHARTAHQDRPTHHASPARPLALARRHHRSLMPVLAGWKACHGGYS